MQDELKDITVSQELQETIDILEPHESRETLLTAKAIERFGREGGQIASSILRSNPEISEEDFWKQLEAQTSQQP